MLGTLVARLKTVAKASSHTDGQPVGDRQAPVRLPSAAHVVGEIAPNARAEAVRS